MDGMHCRFLIAAISKGRPWQCQLVRQDDSSINSSLNFARRNSCRLVRNNDIMSYTSLKIRLIRQENYILNH